MTTQQNVSDPERPLPDYKGRSLCLYHPNSKGTGSALRIEPRINRHDEVRYNCFFLEMASQKTAAEGRGDRRAHATFDWENKITVKMGFLDISEMLTVLDGHAPQMGGERKGLYHATNNGNTLISLSHDPARGTYYLSLSRKKNGAREPQRIGIALGRAESVGLRCLLQTGLFFVLFSSALKSRRDTKRMR